MSRPAPTARAQVRRSADLADYEHATLHAIVDAAYLCHIAFSDGASTHCIPTACWREGDYLYIHGSNGSRLLKLLQKEVQACVTITHLDGLVLARSAFNHTMNYRSAMVYGQFEAVEDKHGALDALMEKIAPGRAGQTRRGNAREFAATTVMRISLAEAACKVRSGGPHDDEDDMAVDAWTGELPWRQQPLAPRPDPLCTAAAPDYVRRWSET